MPGRIQEPSPRSRIPIIGSLIAEFRRFIRGLIRWYVDPQIADLCGQIERLEARLRRFERMLDAPYTDPQAMPAQTAAGTAFDYAGFERRFRGPSELIRRQLAPYASRFVGRRTVLDLGCGRGEFLEALRDAGGAGIGVEADPEQTAECRRRGLNVVQRDLLDELADRPDGSLDGVFSAHVVEHLPFSRLNDLFNLLRSKLRLGGLPTIETVNPHCPAAFKLFHLDPTHVAPLFPELLSFLAESKGFRRVEVHYPVRYGGVLEPRVDCGEYALIAER